MTHKISKAAFECKKQFVRSVTSDKNALLRAVDTMSESRGSTALYESMADGILDATGRIPRSPMSAPSSHSPKVRRTPP